ncbi:GH11723 [Drosophila grimshawi]|uniref:Galectin n=1 Tax=Drosophila grimshawi TaxID=7222 RepID=B4JD56_DROGR|nr:GH11723 [Drosophila grimshawi]
MNIYEGARSIALRRHLDAMSGFYEERSVAQRRKQWRLLEPPVPGLSFFFYGLILNDCEHFVIDFMAKRKSQLNDVVLQIGARLPQNYILRNSRLMGKWGPEENSSSLPFQLKRGENFWMQVLLTDHSFYISVNGYHFALYEYRMPYQWLTGVDVRGDVSDMIINIFYVSEYPIRISHSVASFLPYVKDFSESVAYDQTHTMPRDWLRIEVPCSFLDNMAQYQAQLSLPFYGRMQKKLTDGRELRIEGRVRLMPQGFTVALQNGQHVWPQPTVSFLFNPSFLRSKRAKVGKAVITRSAYINGMWVSREVSRLHTHLGPGKPFVLIIACRRQCYELFINSNSVLTFKHQMNPADVDMVNIRGDLKLWSVLVDSGRLPVRPSGEFKEQS